MSSGVTQQDHKAKPWTQEPRLVSGYQRSTWLPVLLAAQLGITAKLFWLCCGVSSAGGMMLVNGAGGSAAERAWQAWRSASFSDQSVSQNTTGYLAGQPEGPF